MSKQHLTGARRSMANPSGGQFSESPTPDTLSMSTDCEETRQKVVDTKERRLDAHSEYIAAKARLTFLEEAEQKTRMRLEAAKRLHGAFEKKEKTREIIEAELQVAKTKKRAEAETKREAAKKEQQRKRDVCTHALSKKLPQA